MGCGSEGSLELGIFVVLPLEVELLFLSLSSKQGVMACSVFGCAVEVFRKLGFGTGEADIAHFLPERLRNLVNL